MDNWAKYRLSVKPVKKTSTGIVYAGACILHGFLVGTDGVNDPTITIYDHASAASGEEVVPTSVYDASAFGLNGATGMYQFCTNGLYLAISTSGACEVTIQYTPCYYNPGHPWN